MIIKKVTMLVTNAAIKKAQDNTEYCAVGLLDLEEGQKFDISVREPEVYFQLKPMTKVTVDLDLSNSKYGMKLSIKNLVEVGNAI
jgi:hypothetical protein